MSSDIRARRWFPLWRVLVGLCCIVASILWFVYRLNRRELDIRTEGKILEAIGALSALTTSTINNLNDLDQMKAVVSSSPTPETAANAILQKAFIQAVSNLDGKASSASTARVWAEYEALRDKRPLTDAVEP